jgi:calcium-dependent protein kinase
LLLNEVELLKYLNHPTIVDFYEIYESKNKFYIV